MTKLGVCSPARKSSRWAKAVGHTTASAREKNARTSPRFIHLASHSERRWML